MSDKTINPAMVIWEHAAKTDPSHTKTANREGRDQTSISGYWMIQKATEMWGPLGDKWGYDILEERLDVGPPIYKQKADGNVEIGITQTHTLKLELWYTNDQGKKCSFVQYGHTPYVYRSSYGVSTDNEAPKKSLMDAIKKSLSMLGFCSDIFMGQFDDEFYVEGLKAEFDIEKADDADAMLTEKQEEFTIWCKKELEGLALIPNKATLKKVYEMHLNRVARTAPSVGMDAVGVKKRFDRKYKECLEKLETKGR